MKKRCNEKPMTNSELVKRTSALQSEIADLGGNLICMLDLVDLYGDTIGEIQDRLSKRRAKPRRKNGK